jgi:hypothetical protein
MTSDVSDRSTAPLTAPQRDLPRLWFVLLAAVTPLPVLAKAVYYLVVPVDGGASFSESVAALSGRTSLVDVLVLLDAAFCVLLLPATLTLVLVAMRGTARRLTAAGGLVALGGMLVGLTLLGGPIPAHVATVRYGLDPAAMSPLAAAVEGDALLAVAGLLFVVGIVVGLGLLGGALWRGRAVPAWVGLAVLLGGATHPFLPGHTLATRVRPSCSSAADGRRPEPGGSAPIRTCPGSPAPRAASDVRLCPLHQRERDGGAELGWREQVRRGRPCSAGSASSPCWRAPSTPPPPAGSRSSRSAGPRVSASPGWPTRPSRGRPPKGSRP